MPRLRSTGASYFPLADTLTTTNLEARGQVSSEHSVRGTETLSCPGIRLALHSFPSLDFATDPDEASVPGRAFDFVVDDVFPGSLSTAAAQ